MKLVEILARELKEWPENAPYASQSASGNETYFGRDKFDFMLGLSKADDRPFSVITKPEWQEARDELNKPAVEEWNGEGLPPVGAYCEFLALSLDDPKWTEGEILYLSLYTVVISGNGFEHVYHPRNLKFRRIRTHEQIAAEERSAEVSKMMALNPDENPNHALTKWLCEALYDAGYRKQESKPE